MIIPMFFTCARILIAPFLFQAIIQCAWIQAIILFFLGALSDFLDGFFARYLKQESLIGAALDPIADKIFLLTVLYAVSLQVSYIPYWIVVCMIIKEVILIAGAAILLYAIPGFVIKPLWHAKLVTAFSCVALFVVLCAQIQFFFIPESIGAWIMYGCLLANVYVLAEYSLKLYAQIKDNHAQ